MLLYRVNENKTLFDVQRPSLLVIKAIPIDEKVYKRGVGGGSVADTSRPRIARF